MILRILLLACAVVGTYSLGGMLTDLEFKKFEDMCFQNEETDPFRINGQDNPLSNTIENFISLAEKFEAANPNILLKEELFYFLRYYTFENIQLTTEGTSRWDLGSTDFKEINKMWEPDTAYKNRQQQLNDPFSDGEKCSLYYMISHSIVDKPKEVGLSRSMGNTSRTFSTILNIDEFYPQEIGVVAVRGSDKSVSLSRVLVGLYVGLNPNRKQELTSYGRIRDSVDIIGQENLPTEKFVDPLYSLTLAEVVMMAAWPKSNRKGLTRDGHWIASSTGIEKFCPMVSKQSDDGPAYSYASWRGAADGLILGSIVHSIESKKQNTKLSQLLRMYYSLEGIDVEQGTSEYIQANRVTFCNRQEIIEPFTRNLETQMELYGFLVSSNFDVKKSFESGKDLYYRVKDLVYRNDNTELQNYCNRILNLDNVEELPKETFLDVIVVMDAVSEVAFQTQQKISGYLANYLDLRYTASRMTILLDQKINSETGSTKIDLKPVVFDEYSSSCAACTVAQIIYEKSSVEKDQVVLAVDQLLEERKHNESKLNGANGKVVVFFNFDSNGRDNNRVQGRLDRALREFFTRHQNVRVYAVGLETESLKKFARNDPVSVFLSADGNEQEVAQKLYEKISVDGGLLQYPDCNEGRSEGAAVYENFVSPYGIQHWVMPAEYFYKSINFKFTFESQNGAIRVCHNRATRKPENEAKFCNTTAKNNRVEFKLSNPCKSFTKETCAPFYFSVLGMNSNGDNGRSKDFCNDQTDKWCSKLDSIKFKVSHDGIRCSGCLGLGTSPVIVLLAVLLSYILCKMF